ncbi:heat shock protein, alpha-crystallin-related, b15 [Brachyhypopomus gauderio]|uniref:heat shock protein, alpha-crystallin-related, b15 n=1 Tax=Brachyhypopomus gauderio TaxID=698409 RepID=UPI00404157DC
MSRPLFSRNGGWDRLQEWPRSSLLEQCAKEPSLFEGINGSWLDTARKTLEASPWPGFLSFPLVTPVCPEVLPSPQKSQVPLVDGDGKSWRISLDVGHFCPEEISVKTAEGYLEVAGKHEERQDERGIISRSFTRKYKLPAEVGVQQMSSSLSPDGILSVEAPLGTSAVSFPSGTIIPIQKKQTQ